MSELLQDLKALVEMGVEFEECKTYTVSSKSKIPEAIEDFFVNDIGGQPVDFAIISVGKFFRLPSVEWIENKTVEYKNSLDKRHTLVIKNSVYGYWWYSFKGTYKQNSIWAKNKKRLDASVSLLRKLMESK